MAILELFAVLFVFAGPARATDPGLEKHRALARSDLRVIVRSAGYVAALRAQAGMHRKLELIARPLAGELWVICVIDLPNQINMLTDSDMGKLGLSRDEAIAVGTRNVAAELPPGSAIIFPPPSRDAISNITGHFYESSRLLMHEDWAALSQEMNGRLVVSVPLPETVLYIEGKDRADLDALRRVAEATAKDDPRKISTQLFRWVPEGWEVVNP